jgi:predicted dehydrogenase
MSSNSPASSSLDRRKFLSVTAGSVAGAVLATSSASLGRVPGANDRINIGVIGCGNRARALLEAMAGFHREENFIVSAVCDIWKVNREERVAEITKQFGSKPKIFSRYEDMLASSEVDAVMVTTPDHAHSTILAAACRAGKDVFCEKPMAMTVAEANEAVAAVRTNGRVVQIGTQRRSDPIYMGGAKLMHESKLGKVNVVELKWNDAGPRWERDYSNVLASDVDWEGYLMGQKSRSFDARRFRCWHLYRDYSIGVVGLLGAHHTDLVHWYMDEQYPESVSATGGVLSWPNREHYDTLHASYKYPGGFMVHYETRFGNSSMRAEAMFYGSEGALDTKAWKMTGEGRILPERLEPGNRQYPTSAFAMQGKQGAGIEVHPDKTGMDHMRNWVQCIRTRKEPNATVEHGFSHSLAAIMAHRAADIGRRISYDPVACDIREG